MDILVLGAGVSGLTSAYLLLEAGHRVMLWARDLPLATTSNVAGAVWGPFKAYPEDLVTAWGATTYRRFTELARVDGAGVLVSPVFEFFPTRVDDPWWRSAVEGFRRPRPDELPARYADGYAYNAPVIEMPIYLAWLRGEVARRGGHIEHRAVANLAEAFAAANVIVNCTGLGARELVGDRSLYPSRGQVVRVRQRGLRTVRIGDVGETHGKATSEIAYVIPRITDIVLGGTDLERVENTTPDPATTAAILRRCEALDPELGPVRAEDIVSVAVGLRPVRPTVRVERERVAPERWVVHNYGHGGAGVTLSWGCAAEVRELVREIAKGQGV